MRIRTKKIIGGILAGIMLCTLPVLASVYAADDPAPGTDTWLSDWTYEIGPLDTYGDHIHLQHYNGSSGDVTIYGAAVVDGVSYPVCIGYGYDEAQGHYRSGLNQSGGIVHLAFEEKDGKRVRNGRTDRLDELFYGMEDLETVRFQGNFLTDGCVQASSMFEGCTGLRSVDIETVDFPDTATFWGMFRGCSSLEGIHFICPHSASVEYMFENCGSLRSASVSLGESEVGGGSTERMFALCASLEEVDLSEMHTEGFEDFSSMFEGCGKLRSIDLTGMDMQSAYQTERMFKGCKSLSRIDLSQTAWRGEDIFASEMFSGCDALSEITLPGSFGVADSCTKMFYTDTLRQLTVKGSPSASFVRVVMPQFKEDNRYLGTLTVKADVELDGKALSDKLFLYTLAADGEEATGWNIDGTVTLQMYVYRPGETEYTLTESLWTSDPETASVEAIPLSSDHHYHCDGAAKTIKADVALHTDGTLTVS